MPFTTAPNVIEQSDWTGYAPDPEVVSLDPSQLIDVLNLLPDLGSSALETRKGFRRVHAFAGLEAYTLLQVSQWHTSVNGTPTAYIICVFSDHSGSANNVRLQAFDLGALSSTRMDTAGVTWDNPDSWHWGLGIDGKWYGGSEGNQMYSWNPDTGAWDDDVSVGNWKTLVDDVDSGVDTDTEVGRDYAFTGKEMVLYDTDKQFKPAQKIRYDKWESGERYTKGDRVSRQDAWGQTGTPLYWKSWRCIQNNTADATNRPGNGAGSWQDYWKTVRLGLPQDDDGDTNTDDWSFVPFAPQTSIGAWHGDRIWLRDDDVGARDRVMFGAPVKPEKGQDIPELVFNPKDFGPGNDQQGSGGGWISFNDGKHGGQVTSLAGYGQYLLVFKRRTVYVLAGESEESWTVRKLEQSGGCVGPAARTEVEGLMYYLADDGLRVTDGTSAQFVEGMDNIREWLTDRLDGIMDNTDDGEADGRLPVLWHKDGLVWMSLDDISRNNHKYVTLVYDPAKAAFWRLDLPVRDVAQSRVNGVQKMYFCAPEGYGADLDCALYEYNASNDNGEDDTGASVYAGTPIGWLMQTAWWPFSLLREQRRIRRTWAVVRGALTYSLKVYRNWDTGSNVTTSRTVAGTTPVHIEGSWTADCHAIGFNLSSTGQAAVYGIAVQTEPRRTRYHTG